MSKYVIDIDGVICCNTDGDYSKAYPSQPKHLNTIRKINKLYEEGHEIVLFTARGYVTNIDWTGLTKEQLECWGVKYHKLIFGKPNADFYIDDKAINSEDWL